jgi:nicotinate-nucleotide pyrophosphorylase (carboxylating)
MAVLPHRLIVDRLLEQWLLEDLGRGDRASQILLGIEARRSHAARWTVKAAGTIAGLPFARRVFELLDPSIQFEPLVTEGQHCRASEPIAQLTGSADTLLIGERVALNLVMCLSGIATVTRQYADLIADLPTHLVDTRKTTPGLRILEKYASQVGGALNHRMGLDDAVMIKDNHIIAAGGIAKAVTRLRAELPYPLSIEVETETLEQVREALDCDIDIIMLDNMPCDRMKEAVTVIRTQNPRIKIEASGNVTLETIRAGAETGVDYISTSAPISRSSWLDISMKLLH